MKKPLLGLLVIAVLFLLVIRYVEYANAAGPTDDKGRVTLPAALQTDTDQKGRVNLPSSANDLLSLGNIWHVTECCGWSGTWTRRAGTNTFDAKWQHTNGTPVQDVLTLLSWNKVTGQITLSRQGNGGTYTGKIDTGNRRILQGTASWYPAGANWSATF